MIQLVVAADVGALLPARASEAVEVSEVAKLLASDGMANDFFGRSVAVSGDTAVVGAFFDGDNGFASGSAYVFRSAGTAWVEEAKLTASDVAPSDQFGGSVAVSGDTAVVGAELHDDNGSASGSAYVFRDCAFVRGDCNVDGNSNIADPIFILNFLFATGPSPTCEDACDANDDGGFDVSDPVLLLGALFLGEPPPDAPWPFCGIDPAGGDALDCAQYPACP